MSVNVDISCIKNEYEDEDYEDGYIITEQQESYSVEYISTKEPELTTEIEIGPVKIEQSQKKAFQLPIQKVSLSPISKETIQNGTISKTEPIGQRDGFQKKMPLKRKRDCETKKWQEVEVLAILSYMQEHRNVEKPTAQLYYKKLIEETKIEATWPLIRYKVRHLKTSLQKAETYKKTTGEEMEESEADIVHKKVLKICPHYVQLSDIFSAQKQMKVVVCESQDYVDNDATVASHCEEDSSIDESDVSFAEKSMRKAQQTSTMEERGQYRQEQLELEKEKFLWAKEVEERKLRIEETESDQKIKLEARKVENDFLLKQLELEQKERLSKLELEMKYKYKQ